MDVNLILSIAGILLTIILGLYGIYYTKNGLKSSDLSLISHSIIPVFSTLQKRFENIKIEYSGTPISENLIYLSFTLLNNGKFDIDKEKIYKPLELEFPHDYKILECKISGKSSNDINSKILIEGNKIIIQWDLLKISEYISFELFLDIPKNSQNITTSNISKKLQLNFRISDLRKINILDYQNSEPKKLFSSIISIIGSTLGLLFLLFISSTLLYIGIESFTNPYVNVELDEKIYKVTGEVISDMEIDSGELTLIKNDLTIIDKIPLDKAEDLIFLTSQVEVKQNQYLLTFLSLILFSFFIYVGYSFVRDFFKQLRMNSFFKQLK